MPIILGMRAIFTAKYSVNEEMLILLTYHNYTIFLSKK